MRKISGWVAAKDGRAQPGRSGWRSPQNCTRFWAARGSLSSRIGRKDEQITAVSLNLIKNRWVARATPSCCADKAAVAFNKAESLGSPSPQWIELAADEKTLFALEPTNRIVPTTRTRITANITAYSAMSWASSSRHVFQNRSSIFHLLSVKYASRTVSNFAESGGQQKNN